ncbi:hypothetical protein XH92_37960 [Bradyrhizobium sp. CCBAU 53421]|nr:hypothetical protein XH92_37960 [Bradyrhizobium sp. CCBAU 53421]
MTMMRSDQSRTEYNDSWMLAGRLAERQLIESGDANVCVTTSARRSPLRLDEQTGLGGDIRIDVPIPSASLMKPI